MFFLHLLIIHEELQHSRSNYTSWPNILMAFDTLKDPVNQAGGFKIAHKSQLNE